MPITLEQYYNRFDANAPYEAHLFRAGNGAQSAELNEVQSESQRRLAAITDTLFKDGDVLSGADIIVDAGTGETDCEAGVIYLRGAARGVAPATITIPTTGLVAVGIYLTDVVVTEDDDATLRNPAIDWRNFGEPGAARLRVDTAWGYEGDGGTGDFYPVYRVEDGLVLSKSPPPQVDAVALAIARYDRQSAGGYYVSEGMQVSRLADESGDQIYSIAAGVARVAGHEIIRQHARRVVYSAAPDPRQVTLEQHLAVGGTERVDVNHTPIIEIQQISVTKQIDEQLTRGLATDTQDAIPNTPVVQIIEITQGATTYTAGVDYALVDDEVDWSLGGIEPAPGSTYDITYQYIAQVSPESPDDDGFSVTGAVAGTLIQINYTWAMPRYDLICLNADGDPVTVKGVSSPTRPRKPATPTGLLRLCTLHQLWTAESAVLNDAVRLVPMSALNLTNRRIDTLFALVAEERLKHDLTQRDPTAKKGVFADPFYDDDLRDQGLAQTTAIVDEILTLGIDPTIHMQSLTGPATLTRAADVAVVSQPLRTGSMLVNPYMGFSPLPGIARLEPAVDYWTEIETDWVSPITRRIQIGGEGWGWVVVREEETTEEELVGEEYVDAQFLRQILIEFALSGYGVGEVLSSVKIEGQSVTPYAVGGGAIQPADANGEITGQFTIPAGIPAGAKIVEFTGAGGTVSQATFVGRGIITLRTLRLVTTIRTESRFVEPLAETFVLEEPRQISAIKLWFTAVGTTNILLEIRDNELGVPTLQVAADSLIKPADVTVGAWNTLTIDPPVFLEANKEYSFVVACDDAVSALAIAELGQFDATAQKWVTSQPYTVGVLLSGANNRTWTPHQTADLTFELMAAEYAATERTISLSNVSVTDADHLMVLAGVERPTEDTDCKFRITADGAVYEVLEAQPITLPSRLTGTVQLEAVLSGTTELSPTLHKDIELVAATRYTTGDYISRQMDANSGTKITVYFDANLPGSSAVSVYCEEGTGVWTSVPFIEGTAIGDGYNELKYEYTGFAEPETRIKLSLSGSANQLPLIKNLRVAIT